MRSLSIATGHHSLMVKPAAAAVKWQPKAMLEKALVDRPREELHFLPAVATFGRSSSATGSVCSDSNADAMPPALGPLALGCPG